MGVGGVGVFSMSASESMRDASESMALSSMLSLSLSRLSSVFATGGMLRSDAMSAS